MSQMIPLDEQARSSAENAGARVDLVLASGSPRRSEILTRAGVSFEIIRPDIEEVMRDDESPEQLAERLACEKALAVAGQLQPSPPRLVLGSDTIVVLGDEVLGKPDDAEHAVRLLTQLGGQRHRVITGVAVVDAASGSIRSRTVESWVEMRELGESEIRAYVATGEPLDKAGAYALQGEAGSRFVVGIEGSETNIIGLPLEETLDLIQAVTQGLPPLAEARGGELP